MSKKKGARDSRYDWPYATSYLLETLDPDLIEAHAEQILSRALNIGRTVGFIGAGVSMSYGRIGWKGLVEEAQGLVNDYREQAKVALAEPRFASRAADVQRLAETLDQLAVESRDIRSERYPMLFQVSEQLDRALSPFVPTWTGLRKHTAELTISDAAHAHQILVSALARDIDEKSARIFISDVLRGSRSADGKKLDVKRAFADLAKKPSRRAPATVEPNAHRRLFDTRLILTDTIRDDEETLWTEAKKSLAAGEASQYLKGVLQSVLTVACEKRPARHADKDVPCYLLPTDRYLVGVLLQLASADDKPRAAAWWQRVAHSASARKPPTQTRNDLVTQSRDPLLFMQETLRINRFITTNFDGEIERLFEDQSFRGQEDRGRQPLMRPPYEVIVFDNSQAGELTAFAVRDRSARGAVVHLHGRAQRGADDAQSKLIITETDYQKRYLRPDPTRKMVDDAIRLAFGSSPIVFVGSSMGEEDLLRPLRQFMSGPARLGDRVAIALVPSMSNQAQRTEDKIALLGRYGVYAIHFGNCRFRNATGQTCDFEWLPWFWALQKSAREVLRYLSAKQMPQEQERGASERAWGELKRLYENGPEMPASRAHDGIALVASENAACQSSLCRSLPPDGRFELIKPMEIEGARSEVLEVDVEVDLLNAALNWIHMVSPIWMAPHSLIARALLTALEGASDSVLAIFTCARLHKAKRDWDAWKENWYRLPRAQSPEVPRKATAELIRSSDTSIVDFKALITHRHQISASKSSDDDDRVGRFYTGAPSQSAFALFEALGTEAASPFRKATGRRFLLLSSRRGLGSGHLFSALSDCQGCPGSAPFGHPPRVLDLLQALTPPDRENPTKWIGLAFFALSFSQEVMSAFDRMATLLTLSLKEVNRAIHDSFSFEGLERNRIEKLRAALAGWAKHGADNRLDARRVLVSFSSFNIFFDRAGFEKNGQVKRLLQLIFSEEYASAPIDFVFLCQNHRVPAVLISPNMTAPLVALLPKRSESSARAEAERVLKSIGLSPEAGSRLPETLVGTGTRTPAVAIHVLQEARAIVIAAAYFPRVAILMAHNIIQEDHDLRTMARHEAYGGRFDQHASLSRDQVRISLDLLNKSRVPSKVFAPAAMALVAVIQAFCRTESQNPAAEIIRDLRNQILNNLDCDEPCLSAADQLIERRLREDGRGSDHVDLVRRTFAKVAASLDRQMHELFETVEGGRFLLTLIFAAAYETTANLTNLEPSGTPSKSEVDTAAVDMMETLRGIRLTLKGVPAAALPNAVIDEVLSIMRRRSDRGELLTIQLTADAVRKPLLHTLMMEVIWHLSVIGQPVEQHVLECCPRVIAACESIIEASRSSDNAGKPNSTTDESAQRPRVELVGKYVNEALTLATNRCLIYRLVENLAKPNDRGTVRYTVHRFMQRNVFRSLGATISEVSDADQFTLSLFASQPDDLPRLLPEAHREISRVIAALSDYPHGPEGGNARFDIPRYESESEPNKRRRLRATLGIMRIYSVAVLSRFDRQSEEENEELLQEGFFEKHRRRIRWILKAGTELTHGSAKDSPFYAEEVVWLANECAVLSTVQGRLSDAHALFSLAFEAVKEIELDARGPLHVRLLLNRAVCDIERGHSIDTRSALAEIAAMRDEHPVPPMLATGYLGLIDHLAGEVARAEGSYKTAIRQLARLGRSRAASIFSRHYGDMLRGIRQPRQDEAIQQIENAIHFAQEGGHEDMRYLALLSLAKLHIAAAGEIDGARIHKDLDAIESYGRIVGLPRILSDVSLTRARLLLRQGETERAGALVNESLEIVSMNDMRLRKISGLLLLAEINMRRNQRHAARPLLALGIQMSKNLNSHFSLTHAQSLQHQLDAELGSSKRRSS